MKRKFHRIDQNSDQWFSLRLGLVTASNFGKVMANEGKSFGNPASEYAQRISIEGVTGKRIETYQNEYMITGIELEPEAREKYEQETFNIVDNGGFMQLGDHIGGSADGIVGDNGLIEIKSVKFNTHFERLRAGGIDSKYKWQIHGNIWIYNRQWCDFISYCPDFPENKQLYVCRVYRDEEIIKRLNHRLDKFIEMVNYYKSIIS